MSSDSDLTLGFDVFDRDAHPDGSLDVIGAIRNINTAGANSHATRGEISNVLNDADRDYQWIRYRCDSLSDAGVLEINHVQAHDRVEKRYSVADEYLDDARKIARSLAMTGGEIPQNVGVDEFVDLAGTLAEAQERIKDLEAVAGVADGADYDSGAEVLRDDIDDLRNHVNDHDLLITHIVHALKVQTENMDVPMPSAGAKSLGEVDKFLGLTGRGDVRDPETLFPGQKPRE